jgi:hypothetical protein
MPLASSFKKIEGEHFDVCTNEDNLVFEQGLDIHDIIRKGKQSRPPDVDSSSVRNNDSHYSNLSISLVHNYAQVSKESVNLEQGSKLEDVGDAICSGKSGRPPDTEQRK